MKLFSSVVFCGLCLTIVRAYSEDLINAEAPIFLVPEDQTDVEFGFSLSLYTNQTHRNLLIGAPLANTTQQEVTSPGALYSCDLLTKKSEVYCTQLEVDSRDAGDKYVPFIDEDLKDFQRLGASVSSHDNNVVVCAPNWHYTERRVTLTIDSPVGICFRSSSLEGFKPFSVAYDITEGYTVDYLNSGSCQAGFSSTLSKENYLILGSPGCYNWEGEAFAQLSLEEYVGFGKSFTSKDVGGTDEDEVLWLSNMYMGYSVAEGVFKGERGNVVGMPRTAHLNKPIYASSQEDILVMNPMVVIQLIKEKNLHIWTSLTPPKNDRGTFDSVWLFSYFGYSLTVADVDGNGLDDVIVGAPFYHNVTSFDQGAILVYLQMKQNVSPDEKENFFISLERNKLLRMGTIDYGRFGSCVSNVGDLDGNGIQDIAVGAPYGSDGGRVYIYLGTKEGLSEIPYQTLYSSDDELRDRQLRGFGSSFAPLFQIEEGTQNDLAIGAVLSDTVVIFRSNVMIDVKWEVKFPRKMDLESKCELNNKEMPCTDLVTCFSYSFLEKGKTGDTRAKEFTLSQSLDINSSPRRLLFDDSQTTRSTTVFIEFEKVTCHTEKVYTNRQIYNLDAFEIRSAIERVPRRVADQSALKTDQRTSAIDVLEIHFECVLANVSGCISDLHLQTQVSSESVNAEDVQFSIIFEITNFGESSYSNKLELLTDPFLELSGKAEIVDGSTLSPTIDCRATGEGQSQCSLGTFINTNELLRFRLSFVTIESFLQLENLRVHDPKFFVNSSLTTLSEIKFPDAARTSDAVLIETNPVVFLSKNETSTDLISLKEDFEYKSPEEAQTPDEIGPPLFHIYELYNKMSYAVENILLKVYWPYKINDVDFLDGSVVLSQPSELCKSSLQTGYIKDDGKNLSDFGDVIWKMTSCNLLYLEPQTSVDLRIDLRPIMKTLIEEVSNPDFDQISSYVKLESNPVLLGLKLSRVVTNQIKTRIDYGNFVFQLVPKWVYAVGALIGLIILIILICCLRKCNFFQRNKKEILTEEIEGEEEEVTEVDQMIPGAAESEEYDNV